MTLYNETFLDTANTWVDLFKGLDNAAPALIGSLIIFSLLIIMISSLKQRDWSALLIAAGFLGTIVSGYFYLAGLIPLTPLAVCIVLLVGSIIARVWLDV